MAITKSQQARQMLKKGTSKPVVQGGVDNYLGKQPQVVAPRKWQSGPDKPPTELAYITEAEKKLLLKEDIHGSLKKGPNVGPSGIMSLDSFGDADGSGMAGGDVSRAESGDFGPIGGGGGEGPELPPGVTRKTKPTKTEQELRNAFIAAGGGQRVNPGFFDSRNTVSPAELAAAKAFAPRAFAKSRGSGIMNLITGGGFLGNLIRGLGQRFGLGKRFDQPTYDMSRFSGLPLGGSAAFQNLDIRDIYDRRVTDEDDNEEDTNMITPKRKPEISFTPSRNPVGGLDQLAREIELLEATRPGRTTIDTLPGSLRDFYVNKQGLSPTTKIDIVPDDINFTPFQKDVIEDTQDQADDPFLQGAMADALTTPTEGKFGVSLNDYLKLKKHRL